MAPVFLTPTKFNEVSHALIYRRGGIGLPTKHHVRIQINRRRRYVLEAEEPPAETCRAPDSVSNASRPAMSAPAAVEQYRKQQEELERQRREEERLAGFDFTRMLLQKLGLRVKR
ncbi:hypothetical protein Q9R34_12745 [Enterobacter sp. BRE11]|nr:hypothetical protein [Enterobacter sp. BRE11]